MVKFKGKDKMYSGLRESHVSGPRILFYIDIKLVKTKLI